MFNRFNLTLYSENICKDTVRILQLVIYCAYLYSSLIDSFLYKYYMDRMKKYNNLSTFAPVNPNLDFNFELFTISNLKCQKKIIYSNTSRN